MSSKAKPATTPDRTPVSCAGSKQGPPPTEGEQRSPVRPATTQDLIAWIWGTLDWPRTMQTAFIIAVTGITVTLMLAGLVLLAHAMNSQKAAWPAGASLITVMVTYQAARRRRR